MEKKWLEMIREVICSNSSCKGETCEHCFCDDDLDKEEIERVFNLIIQSEKQKIIDRLNSLKEVCRPTGDEWAVGFESGYNEAIKEMKEIIKG